MSNYAEVKDSVPFAFNIFRPVWANMAFVFGKVFPFCFIIFCLLCKDISCKAKPRWMRFRVSIVVSQPSVYSENGFSAHSVTANCRAILPEEAE